MEHKIGDIAKLMGLTPEAIRYYEKMGIISPIKSHDSGYRYYSVWDIHVLIRARAYRQYGFSMNETVDLISKQEPENIVSRLSEEEDNLQEMIIWNLNLLQHLHEMQEIIKDAVNSIGKYRIGLRPAMYFLKTQDGYDLIDSRRELYRSWIEKIPFVFPGGVYGKSVCENHGEKFAFGLIVEEKYTDLLHIDKNEDIVYLPACPSLYTSFQSGSKKTLSPKTFTSALRFMKSQGLKLSGDIVSRVGLMTREGSDYLSWHQVWLPFEHEITRNHDTCPKA